MNDLKIVNNDGLGRVFCNFRSSNFGHLFTDGTIVAVPLDQY